MCLVVPFFWFICVTILLKANVSKRDIFYQTEFWYNGGFLCPLLWFFSWVLGGKYILQMYQLGTLLLLSTFWLFVDICESLCVEKKVYLWQGVRSAFACGFKDRYLESSWKLHWFWELSVVRLTGFCFFQSHVGFICLQYQTCLPSFWVGLRYNYIVFDSPEIKVPPFWPHGCLSSQVILVAHRLHTFIVWVPLPWQIDQHLTYENGITGTRFPG